MKLKTISQVTLVLILLAALLSLIGYAATFLPILSEYFGWGFALSAVTSTSVILLRTVGLTIFLLAFIKLCKTPNANGNMAFVIASILILLAMMVGAGASGLHSFRLFGQMPRLEFLLFAVTSSLGFASAIFMSLFILTRATSKLLALLTIISQLSLFALNVTSFIRHLPNMGNADFPRLVGWITSYSAYGLHTVAILLFLITFLATPKSNPPAELKVSAS